MLSRISNMVSSHELATSGLIPFSTNLGKESTCPLLPTIINPDPNILPNDTLPYLNLIVEDTPDFTKYEHFVLVAPFPTLTEFEEGAESPRNPNALRGNIMSSILIGSVVDDPEIPDKSIESDDDYRHWSAKSQPFAPADVLLQYLQDGWKINNRVVVEVFPCLSRQCVELYCFMLLRDKEYVTIPVVANPVILRLTREFSLTLIRV
jgi:hypothetical protein